MSTRKLHMRLVFVAQVILLLESIGIEPDGFMYYLSQGYL